MNAYRVQVFDKNAYPDSLIDNMIVLAPSIKGAIAKAEKHAKDHAWSSWEIRDVVKFSETVLP